MNSVWLFSHVWLVPALPLAAAGLLAITRQRHRTFAGCISIAAITISVVVALGVLVCAIHEPARHAVSFPWFQVAGDEWLHAGWVVDPLSAIMIAMVSFISLLIFIYSWGYMARDENLTRFFCFLSLFAAAMLGLVLANNLLVLFMCWELVGISSYLLIGFWFHRPAAAAAAKKAFIVTRIGDLAFLLGIVWLYWKGGTLTFYADGKGCLEAGVVGQLVAQNTSIGMAVSTGISLLIFCGAIGKSGQVPLHVWLPDAMEGPTPVSALIHAATMVAAGVFLMARMYPLVSAALPDHSGSVPALAVITWVGTITAVFAASIAVAQSDIKRILAYSTVSQLGFMMMGLGTGGAAVAMFHLITHAFFKALLFLGAGSIIHGCGEEQNIRQMGGLRRLMPVTFATYAIGMMALSGVPILFSGFWSKDEILHSAQHWAMSKAPFYLGLLGALLTAFYMTRQVAYVFFGSCRLRLGRTASAEQATLTHAGLPASEHPQHELDALPHESPLSMTIPLVVLAIFAIGLGFLGTPVWPAFQDFLGGKAAYLEFARLGEPSVLSLLIISSSVVFLGIWLAYLLYGREEACLETQPDALQKLRPDIFALLERKFFVDEAYQHSFVRLNAWWAMAAAWLDFWIWNGVVNLCAYLAIGMAYIEKVFDQFAIDEGFDRACQGLGWSGKLLARLHAGKAQLYLRVLASALVVLTLFLVWGWRR